jgi:hypothetical protein
MCKGIVHTRHFGGGWMFEDTGNVLMCARYATMRTTRFNTLANDRIRVTIAEHQTTSTFDA